MTWDEWAAQNGPVTKDNFPRKWAAFCNLQYWANKERDEKLRAEGWMVTPEGNYYVGDDDE